MLWESKEFIKNIMLYPVDPKTKNNMRIHVEPTTFKITLNDLKILMDVASF